MTVTLKVNLPAPTRRTARNALAWLVAWVLLASIATAAMTMTKPAGTSTTRRAPSLHGGLRPRISSQARSLTEGPAWTRCHVFGQGLHPSRAPGAGDP